MYNKKLQGISLLFLTTALYGLYGIYARLIAQQFDVFSQNWVRNTFVMMLSLVLMLIFRQKWKKIVKKDVPWIATWVVCDILFVITLFISFNNLPIGTALFLLYSGSTISGYLSGTFLLKEKLTKIKILAILLSISGLIFIYGGQIYSTKILFLFLGLGSGLITGLWNVLPKLISKEYPKLQLITLDAAGILIVNLILAMIYHQTTPNLTFSLAWLGLVLYGISQLVGDLLIIRGFRLVEAHIESLILPFEAIFGAIFAFMIFAEILPASTVIGGLLILSGAFIPLFQKNK